MKEFKGDKRTKEYKEWKKNYAKQSKGFGDTIEKFTEATGIKKLVKFVAGEDCGCEERKDKLNKVFRYEKPKCLEENEYNILSKAIESKQDKFTVKDQSQFISIYERVFNTKVVGCTSCSFKSTVYNKLVELYKIYN